MLIWVEFDASYSIGMQSLAKTTWKCILNICVEGRALCVECGVYTFVTHGQHNPILDWKTDLE